MTLIGFGGEPCRYCGRAEDGCPCGKGYPRCRQRQMDTGDPCRNYVSKEGEICIYCAELNEICRFNDKAMDAELCTTCAHSASEHASGVWDCGADARCKCVRFVQPARGPLKMDGGMFARALETMEARRGRLPSPVVCLIAAHQDGTYTMIDHQKPIILYVDERNSFGKLALSWFEGIGCVTIPIDGGLPEAVQGKARYRWKDGELEQFARSLRDTLLK